LQEFAESEFEKYRIIQDRLFQSDFDRFEDNSLPPLDMANSLAYSAETFPLSCNIELSNKFMNLSIRFAQLSKLMCPLQRTICEKKNWKKWAE